jgi:pimeloyl-ACP methyl ester carboxylesterase
VLAQLALARPVLVGHSMGGGIALHRALRSPERVAGVALINPVGLVPLDVLGAGRLLPRWPFRVLDGRITPRWLIRLILRHVAYGNAELVTRDVVDEYWSPTQLSGFAYATRATVDEFEWRPITASEAASLAVPCVVILGASDRLVRNSRFAANRLAGASVDELPGGHCVHEEDPGRVNDIIARFVMKSR